LISAYRKWALKHYRHADGSQTGTAENMRPLMRRLRQWYGTVPVSEFRPLAFKDAIKRLIGEGLSISTVNNHISRIKHLFRWGVSEELVPVATREAIDSVSSEHQGRSEAKLRKIVEAVPDAVVEQTMDKLPEVIRAMVKLQRLTGMRPAVTNAANAGLVVTRASDLQV
jgi:site-specific recombinase XerD